MPTTDHNTTATPAGHVGSTDELGPPLAESDMGALAAVAHQAGLSGIDLHALARVLDVAQRIAAAAERERIIMKLESAETIHAEHDGRGIYGDELRKRLEA